MTISRINFLVFTLTHDWDKYNGDMWFVESHRIFGWHPCWGPHQRSRVGAVLTWLANVWEDFYR